MEKDRAKQVEEMTELIKRFHDKEYLKRFEDISADDRAKKLEELTEIIRRLQDAEEMKKFEDTYKTMSADEKERLKELVSDPFLLCEALLEFSPIPDSPVGDNSRSDDQIVADNYIALAKFVIEEMQLKNVHKLQVKDTDCGFVIYALTPEPVELDFYQYVSSDYPDKEELLLEAESLQGELEGDEAQLRLQIIQKIEDATL